MLSKKSNIESITILIKLYPTAKLTKTAGYWCKNRHKEDPEINTATAI
jgi:hypothetical protein